MTDLHYLSATEPLQSFRARELSPAIVGKTYDDVAVFRIAAAHERQMPWLDMRQRRPAL